MREKLTKNSYIGEVFYLDSSTGKIVAQGHGHLDISKLKLKASMSVVKPGSFKSILVVIKTPDGYIAPFASYKQTLLSGEVRDVSYDIRAYLHWSISRGITFILHAAAPSISITIHAQHIPDSIHSVVNTAGTYERLTKFALSKKLESATYKSVDVNNFAGYSIRRHSERARDKSDARLATLLKYQFECRDKPLTFVDLGKILLAFKLYWICYFDHIDCQIDSIKLGDDISLYLAKNHLYAMDSGASEYRAILQINRELHSKNLAKMTYYFLNPKRNKRLGATSKLGLAFARITDYRFSENSEVFFMDVTSLIFALQSFAEAIAEREFKQINKHNKQANCESIQKVIAAIKAIEKEITSDVRDFYLRSEAEIYALMTRPTFMKSLKIALDKLGIDISNYKSLLKSINSARRQVVHSEGYDVEFLLSLLTDTATQGNLRGKDADSHPKIIRKNSEINELYKLLRLMIKRFFDTF